MALNYRVAYPYPPALLQGVTLLLLAIDIGNTETVVGLYRGELLLHHWRLHSDLEKTADEYGLLLCQLFSRRGLDPSEVKGVVIASVLPPALPTFEQMAEAYFPSHNRLVVDSRLDTGLIIRYDPPHDVGADRIANAVAAMHKYTLPAIVVDFGTATTFDCISKEGEYLGGAIAPGIGISLEALFERASKLPRIALHDPGSPIGRNTIESMQAGIVYGAAGQVERIVEAIQKELAATATVIATGPLSDVIARHCPSVSAVDAFLTLDGLRIIYERSAKSSAT